MLRNCSLNCGRTSTPKGLTTPQRRYRKKRRRIAWEFAWRLLATRNNTPQRNYCGVYARRRMTEPRFLVVRLGSLGDIVHAFPAVSGLQNSYPNAGIIWLTHPKWEFLVKTAELATEVCTVETRNWENLRRVLGDIRKYRFEMAIDYQGLWKSGAIPFLARVPRRIGFSSETVREACVQILYTDRVKVTASAHVADQNGELSLRAGARVPTGNVTLHVP